MTTSNALPVEDQTRQDSAPRGASTNEVSTTQPTGGSPVGSWLKRLGRYVSDGFFAPQSAHDLAIARVLLFGFVAQQSYSYERWYKFTDEFWAPVSFFAAWHIPLLSESVVAVMVPVLRLAAVGAAAGVAFRWTAPVATLLFWYLKGMQQNFGKVDHADCALALGLLVLSCSRAADGWSLRLPVSFRVSKASSSDKRGEEAPPVKNRWSPEYRWPLQLVLLVVVTMYFSAGWNKHDRSGWSWALSDNMLRQMLAHEFSRNPPTDLGVFLSGYPAACKALGLWSLLVELLAPVALLHRRLGYFMVVNLMALQLGIYLTMGVYFGGMIPVFLSQLPWYEGWAWVSRRRSPGTTSPLVS